MKTRTWDSFGEACVPLLGVANLGNVFWTANLLIEQFTMQFPGTEMELFVLVMWLTEFLSLPIAIMSVVYLCIRRKKKYWKWVFTLLLLLIFQIALCNLLINV